MEKVVNYKSIIAKQEKKGNAVIKSIFKKQKKSIVKYGL
jgi:hypothetical protein